MTKYKYPDWFINELANETDKERAINNTLGVCDRVEFICPYHGIYKQEVRVHIKKSTGEKIGGCRLCGHRNRRKYEQWFIDMLVHDEDKEKAKNNTLNSSCKVDFYCPKHGVFNTVVAYITYKGKPTGVGCPSCGKERQIKKIFRKNDRKTF